MELPAFKPSKVGLLHPGEMGAAVGQLLRAAGHEVLVALADRSDSSKRRAAASGLSDAGSLAALLQQVPVLLSIVPPDAAMATARSVAAAGFKGEDIAKLIAQDLSLRVPYLGIYADLNATSPDTVRAMGAVMRRAGATLVDGAIIGPPPKLPPAQNGAAEGAADSNPAAPPPSPRPAAAPSAPLTSILLSGDGAVLQIMALFIPVQHCVRVDNVGEHIGRASAIKMCHAAYSKGRDALLLNIAAMAWTRRWPRSGTTGCRAW
jgi:hypothetical protein